MYIKCIRVPLPSNESANIHLIYCDTIVNNSVKKNFNKYIVIYAFLKKFNKYQKIINLLNGCATFASPPLYPNGRDGNTSKLQVSIETRGSDIILRLDENIDVGGLHFAS